MEWGVGGICGRIKLRENSSSKFHALRDEIKKIYQIICGNHAHTINLHRILPLQLPFSVAARLAVGLCSAPGHQLQGVQVMLGVGVEMGDDYW